MVIFCFLRWYSRPLFFFLFACIGGAALVYQASYGLSPSTFVMVFCATGFAVLFGVLASGLTLLTATNRVYGKSGRCPAA